MPQLSKTRARGLKPGEIYYESGAGRELIYIGTEHHAFVDKGDFDEWSNSLYQAKKHWYPMDKKITKAQWGEFTIDGQHLEWAIGMIWPDQSYVSLRWYRGPHRIYWSSFHEARLDMLAGEFIHP